MKKFLQQRADCSNTGPGTARAFNRDFTINLYPQCRAFSRALQTEKFKAPLFPGPVGAGTKMSGA